MKAYNTSFLLNAKKLEKKNFQIQNFAKTGFVATKFM